ncbi:isoprenylcysteine carboxylmethyltransferase family protein [Catellatospora sp. NPDC049111]|uniref:methyltransferase family protein n=1 Tax=Catellatospora sp. NPDC049111 TaxID=3155271 RepID=UPI0033F7B7C7
MYWTAFAVYVAGLVTAIGGRTLLHYVRTGESGHRHSHPRFGTGAWGAQLTLGLALPLGAAAPLLAAMNVLAPPAPLVNPIIQAAGLLLATLGFVGVLAAQQAMGASWRIGADGSEQTRLITTGVFRVVRNPVFTAMLIAVAGLTAAVPSVLQLVVFLLMLTGIQLQVRYVEEPALRQAHGQAFESYAASTGRFLPAASTANRRQKPPTPTA